MFKLANLNIEQLANSISYSVSVLKSVRLPSLPGACRKWGVQVYGLVWLGEIPYTSVLPRSVCSASCRPLLWGEETEVRSTGQKLRKHISTPLTVVYSIAEIKAVNWKWPTKKSDTQWNLMILRPFMQNECWSKIYLFSFTYSILFDHIYIR